MSPKRQVSNDPLGQSLVRNQSGTKYLGIRDSILEGPQYSGDKGGLNESSQINT